jgi:ABC-2 type transport system permease protein
LFWIVESGSMRIIRKNNNRGQHIFELFFGLTLLIILNFLTSFYFYRFDFTKEKRYSLSDGSIELAEELKDVVYVRVYLEGDFPAGFKRLRNATQELLEEFKAYAGDNIQYEFIDPTAEPNAKIREKVYQQLASQGIQPTTLQTSDGSGSAQKLIFPGAMVTYRGDELPMSLLLNQAGLGPEEILNNSVQNLEYAFASTLRRLNTFDKPDIAFVYGHEELDTLKVNDILSYCTQNYEVRLIVLPEAIPEDLERFKALVIAKPLNAFSEKDKYKIDQYLMKGGSILMLNDGLFADMDSMYQGELLAIDPEVNLDDQLFIYGLRLNHNLVQDFTCLPIPIITGNVGGKPQQQLMPWLYYPLVIPSSNHPIVNNLDGIKTEFVSSIDTFNQLGVKHTVLLHSSKYSKVINGPVRVSLSILGYEPNPEQFTESEVPLAVLTEGNFTSAFENRLTPESQEALKPIFKSQKPGKIILVGDGDIIKNYVSKKDENMIYPLGYDRFTNQTFANKTFIENALDYLVDGDG